MGDYGVGALNIDVGKLNMCVGVVVKRWVNVLVWRECFECMGGSKEWVWLRAE